IVVLVAISTAKAAVLRLLVFDVFEHLFDAALEAVDLELGVLRGFDGLELPANDGEVIASGFVVDDFLATITPAAGGGLVVDDDLHAFLEGLTHARE
ncbi:MAG: hypothetical protein ACK55I_16285, partial [bacterium]